MASLLAPVALLVGLALYEGGFDVEPRHIAGLVAWLVVVALLVLGAASAAKRGRPLYVAVGLIGGLALLCALSSLWSGSVELSVIEADRVLVYLGFFLAAFLIAQTDQRAQRFAEGIAIAVATMALLGLASRLLPHVLEVSHSFGAGARLRYPLGYWNANGAAFGIGVALLLWTSRQSVWRSLRWISVALIPAMLLALYFTYSRGGLLSLVIATGTLLVLSRDRLWLLATLAIGALGALPAVLAVQARRDLADGIGSQAAVDQGLTVLFILLAGVAVTLLLFLALRRLEQRRGPLTGHALKLSRNPAVLRRAALAGAIVAIGVAVAIGGRAWHQFTTSDVEFPNRPEHRLLQLGGAGRSDFWSVAVDAFGEKPVLGTGAGTYKFSWDQHRSIDMAVHDAHSLYLEAFAELGVIGGLLVLALVGTLLWQGYAAWRDSPRGQRDRNAALLAVMVAFAVSAGLDWFWEIAGLGALFFLAAGVLIAVRCGQLTRPEPEAPRGSSRPSGAGFGLAVVGLGLAWLSAIALVGPLLVKHEISASQAAVGDENLASAVNHAETAKSIEPWAASPYVQLGLLAELSGEYTLAVSRFSDAIEREDHNWQLYYLRSRAKGAAGDPAGASADLEEARKLNPRAPELAGGAP